MLTDKSSFNTIKPANQRFTKHILFIHRKDLSQLTLNIKHNFKSSINPKQFNVGTTRIREVAQAKLILQFLHRN